MTSALFNERGFHALNLGPGERSLQVGHEDEGRLVGTLAGVVRDATFTSGHSAPFGGPDFARPRETAAAIEATVAATVDQLRDAGVRTVRVRAKPPASTSNEPLVLFALLNAGFEVERCDLNHHIDLRPFADAAGYVASLRPPARRALRHLEAEPFAFAEAAPDDEDAWERGYGVLAANRASRGWALPLSLAYVRRARDAFPGRIRLHELTHAGAACAVALVYRVHDAHALVVSWGDAFHELERSPMNLLALRVVERAIADGVDLLDLGTSTVPGAPERELRANAGLARFKVSVGAQAAPRLTLVREV